MNAEQFFNNGFGADVEKVHRKHVIELMTNFAKHYHTEQCNIPHVSGSLRFSEREVDFAYLCGVFNTSGIDGLHTEIQRLKELGKEPHDIIEACRKQ